MTKKPHISEDEKSLFRDAVSDVKPLSPQNSLQTEEPETTKPEKIKTVRIKKIILTEPSIPIIQKTKPQPTVYGDDIISFAKSGLQHRRFSQLKQGKIKAEATLDLHEHTSDEALIAIDDFLNRCQQRNMKTVCVIHGKGHFSTGNTPVLKNLLNHYLREHPSVIAFHSAKRTEGGTGAIYVLLKSI